MLKFIYQYCYLPFYTSLCKNSQADGTFLKLELAISILFDLMNVFCLTKDDAYRKITFFPNNSSDTKPGVLLQVN